MPKKPDMLTISIRVSTSIRLDKLKHPGQSWDGIITEILDKAEPQKIEGTPAIMNTNTQSQTQNNG